MGTCRIFSLLSTFVILPNGGLSRSFEHMLKEAQKTELKILLIHILPGAKRFLTIITLYKTLKLFFGRMSLEISKDHLHFFLLLVLILAGEGGIAVALHVCIIDDHRFRPYLHVLISGIVHLDMQVVRPAADRAFLVQCGQFFEEEAAQRRIFFGVKHFMLILDRTAYFCEVVEFVLETMSPSFCVLLQTTLRDFWVIGEVTLNVIDLLVAHIFFLYIAEDVVMELCIETEKHFRVVKVATFTHLLVHGLEETLIHAYFVDFEL